MKKRYKIVLILSVCFLIRFVYWFIWNKLYSPLTIPDTAEYIELGQSFFEKGDFMLYGIPSSKRPPLYPLCIGIYQKFFGRDGYILPLTFTQIIFSCLSAILLFFIVKNLFGITTGIISLVLYSVDPLMIFRIPHITTEPLFLFLIIGLILLIFLEQKYKTKLHQISLGIFLVLPALQRAEGIILFIFFPIFFFLTNRINYSNIKRFLLIFSSGVIIMLPWWIRNYTIHGRFVLTSTHGGVNFLCDSGAHPLKKGSHLFDFVEKKYRLNELSGKEYVKNESYYEKILYKEKIDYALRYPINILKIVIKNYLILHYFTSFPRSNRFDPVYGVILCFTLIGIFFLVKNWKEYPFKFLIYYLFMIYFGFALTYSFYVSDPRMRNSIEPILIILASYGLKSIFENKKKSIAILYLGLILSINVFLFFSYSNYVRPSLVRLLSLIIGFPT